MCKQRYVMHRAFNKEGVCVGRLLEVGGALYSFSYGGSGAFFLGDTTKGLIGGYVATCFRNSKAWRNWKHDSEKAVRFTRAVYWRDFQ